MSIFTPLKDIIGSSIGVFILTRLILLEVIWSVLIALDFMFTYVSPIIRRIPSL